MNTLTLDYFDFYVKKGFNPIPVYKRSKVPIGLKWNKKWNKNFNLNYFQNHECNIGILLGEIVDVEADTEEANQLLTQLIGDIKHPCYKSYKSFHHFFINPDPYLTAIRYKDIEFRGNKHHSVVPPSLHENGTEYKWVESSVFPPPEMPDSLLDFYNQIIKSRKTSLPRQKNKKIKIKPFHAKTICKKCNKTVFLHKKRLILEVAAFKENNLIWTCRECRDLNINSLVKKMKKKEKYNS